MLFRSSILENPTLALRSFSQYLVKTDFGKIAAVDNALFRGSFENITNSESGTLNSAEMAKVFFELLLLNREGDRETISQIMNLLIDWRNRNG